MKNIHIFSAFAIAALSIAACQKEVSPAEESSGKAIELNAAIEQTKTTFDPATFKVSWVNGDVITATGTGWTATFTYDASIEKFITTDAIPEGPQTDVDFQYGKTSSATQNMDCENPLAHIAMMDKLTGKASFNLSESPVIDVTLAHTDDLMAVTVKNGTEAPLTIAKLIFNIRNTKYSTTGKSITLNVSKCEPIAAGSSYTLYFLKAAMGAANYDITLTVVNDKGKEYTKKVNRDWEIVAGTYNPTPYTVSKKTRTLTFNMSEIGDLVGNKDAIANGTYELTAVEDGEKYPFSLYQGYTLSPSYSDNGYLELNVANYLGTPAIEGASLYKFTFTLGYRSATSAKSAMTTATHDGKLNAKWYDAAVENTSGSMPTAEVGNDYTFTIKDEVQKSNMSYYLVCGNKKIGVSKVVLIYELD